jgi:hypothetical protein
MKNTDNHNNTPMERVCLLDPSRLAETRERLQSEDKSLALSLRNLCETADKVMQIFPYSVMDKRAIPPSGDKHDYMSLGTYWWPNPDTADGLPYVRRDGKYNPEGDALDVSRVGKLCRDCSILAYAFYFTGNSEYSKQSISLLRTWFLDQETRMNPHLNYAQSIPGICEGRDIGIIDTSGFSRLLDAIGLLKSSTSSDMPSSTFDGIKDWMNDYLDWLVDSPNGKDEASQKNNHGTWYDVQVVSLAIFTGRRDLPVEICEAAREKRVSVQIAPDGSQPLELRRTCALDYTVMNIKGMLDLGILARNVGVDLLSYATPDGRGIRKTVDWLIPYAIGEKTWAWEQIRDFDKRKFFEVFRRAAIYYGDPQYEDVLRAFNEEDVARHEMQLIYPKIEGNDTD